MTKFSRWSALRLVALIAAVTFIWCLNNDRLNPANWQAPLEYDDDVPLALATIKASSEGDYRPFLDKTVHRLGAPYDGNWNDWPSSGEVLVWVLGRFAKWFGLLPASNLAVLLGFVSSAIAFYACCRFLRFRREWAFVTALLFAFTFFHSFRGLHHLLFTYSWSIPLLVLCSWLVGFSRRMQWGDRCCWLCLVSALVIGIGNPYPVNIFGQLLCVSLVVNFFTQRRKVNLQIGAVMIALLGLGFFCINLDTFVYQASQGKNPDVLLRGYYESELFALKPIEMVVPPVNHKSAGFASIGSRYFREAWLKGEVSSPYLGVVALAGLLWLAIEVVLWAARLRRRPRRAPAYGLTVFWVLTYAVVAGVNCLIALGGLPLFRGTNRYSIVISAVVLMFLASRLSRLTRNWSLDRRLLVAVPILLIGLWDTLPLSPTPAETGRLATMVQVDRAFAVEMESKLPPKSMVFQLPVMPFPESTPVQGVASYDLLRPYLYSSSLRFSFGANKGRPQEDWQKEVAKLPGDQLAATLERYGFAALYINRKGFPDQAKAILGELAASGRSQILEDGPREQVCVLLKPSTQPVLPPESRRVQFEVRGGWVASNPSPGGIQHWSGGRSRMSFFSGKGDSTAVLITCQLGSLMSCRLTVKLNGRVIWDNPVTGGQLVPVNLTLDARHGNNRLEFISDVTERPSRQNPVPRIFVMVNPSLSRN